MEIKIKKISPSAKMPVKSYEFDAGFDFYCTAIIETPNYIEYHTGITLDIPQGMVGLLFPRSSVTNKDLMLKNSIGVIDSGYHGEILFRFADIKQYTVTQVKEVYAVGDRIGQIIFIPIPEITLLEVDELPESLRGTNGLGSSGK